MASGLGAEEAIDPTAGDPVARIREITGRGVAVSLDAIGQPLTCQQSIRSLANRGRHVQVGLLTGKQSSPQVPMDAVIAHELEILGSHGMPVSGYRDLMALVESGRLDPARLVSDTIGLDEGASLLERFDSFPNRGMTMITFP